MAVAFDAVSEASATNSTTHSVNHTASGANRLALVVVGWGDGTPASITALTYGGTSITANLVGSEVRTGTTKYTTAVYYVIAPATSSTTAQVTFSENTTYIHMAVVSFTGVNQTTPTSGAQTATGSSTTPSTTVTSETDDLVFSSVIIANNSITLAPNGSQTERYDTAVAGPGGAAPRMAGMTAAGASSVTMDWLASSLAGYATVACNIEQTGPAHQIVVTAMSDIQ